jgi:RNA polymerase sigma-70 factor (ECF subfamily)
MRPDEELVREVIAATEGDTRAFEQLVRRHQASILANCRYLTRSDVDAEDLAQEVFVKVFFKLSTFEERSRFRTWVQQIKINHCLNYQKSRKGRRFVDLDEPGLEAEESLRVEANAADRLEAAEDRSRIRLVLESMPDPLRIPLVLCDVDGLSYQEIADALSIGLSATKMRIARARELFRRRYLARAGEPATPASPPPVSRPEPLARPT